MCYSYQGPLEGGSRRRWLWKFRSIRLTQHPNGSDVVTSRQRIAVYQQCDWGIWDSSSWYLIHFIGAFFNDKNCVYITIINIHLHRIAHCQIPTEAAGNELYTLDFRKSTSWSILTAANFSLIHLKDWFLPTLEAELPSPVILYFCTQE